jgi:hypothetical protein
VHELPTNVNEVTMKKPSDKPNKEVDELREHYDLDYGQAKPNRFADQFSQDAVVVVLDADVAAAFPTPESVNEALRLVLQLSLIPVKAPGGS